MSSPYLYPRGVWSTAPPEPRTRAENWPTLLYSWWATGFAAAIIIVRLCGRKVRSNVLFREDWIMFLALVPLCIRMACIHVVLLYGTNNVQTIGAGLTEEDIRQRRIGSRLVLASRIWYAVFIWMSKWTVSEFLKRITLHLWRTSYEYTLHCIRVFLVVTLVAVVIATLAECQPFDHYWQVIPDPGAQCRQGFAQLLTMGTADIITDILLVAFPIPIVLRSGQTWRRKIQLAALFSTSVALIVITGMRMPEVISRHGRQQYRTVWASSEILASAFVSNFVIIGSFLRDKGTKRNKYKSNSVSDSIDRASVRRQPTIQMQSMGSDEDLFRFLGCRVPAHLQEKPDFVARPAPAALPATRSPFYEADKSMQSPMSPRREPTEGDDSPIEPLPSPAASTLTKKNVSFFDVGGLLEDGDLPSSHSPSETRSFSTTIIGSSSVAQDFAPPSSRRGSSAFMADMGGLTPSTSRSEGIGGPIPIGSNGYARRGSLVARVRNGAPIGILGPMLERQETAVSLQDAGGLLSEPVTPLAAPADHGNPRPEAQRAPRGAPPGLARRSDERASHEVDGLIAGTAAPLTLVRDETAQRRPRTSPAATNAVEPPQSRSQADELSLHDAGGLLDDGSGNG